MDDEIVEPVNDEMRFGEFRLDLRAQALLRGDDTVPMTPKALALLRHFAERAGSLVTREELFARHWSGKVVTDGALSRCIRELRAALGDDVHNPRYLATVHRRGYRFVAHVQLPPKVADTRSSTPLIGVPLEPFVGRQATLDQAAAFVREVISRRVGAVVEISGEPGAGKSRLLAGLTALGPSLGVRALVVHASESRGAPPFWLWIQVLRALRGDRPGDTAEGIENLLESRHRYGVSFADRTSALDRERFDIRQAVVRHVCRTANTSPLLLVMEDLHAAEPDCLELLADLAKAIFTVPIAIVVTYRDAGAPRNDSLNACLADIARSGVTLRRMLIRGLGIDAVREWLAAEMGESAASELAQLALDKTGGNPLYLRELLALPSDDAVDRAPGLWAVDRPETVQQLLLRRLQLLSPVCLQTLERAAVIGDVFSTNLLLRCSDLDEAQVLPALRAARAERLVSWLDTASQRWRFSHGLVREVLYDRIEAAALARHHSIVGEALEHASDGDNEVPYAQLALHFSLATRSSYQAGKVSHYLLLAGRRAQESFAHNEAEAHFAALVNHLERHCPQELARLSEAWCGRAVSAAHGGRPDVARHHAHRALEIARAANDIAGLGLAASTVCSVQPAYPPQPQLIELLDEALTMLPGDQHALRGRLLAQRAFQHYVQGDMAQLCVDARRAEVSARSSGDDRTLEAALQVLSYSFVSPADDLQRRAVYEERFAIARRLNDPGIEYSAQYSRLEHVLQTGPSAAAIDAEMRKFEACVRRIDLPTARAALLRAQAGLAIAHGELDRAWTLAERALQEGQTSTDAATAHAVSLLHFAALLNLRGQLSTLRGEIEQDTEVSHNSLMRAGQIHLRNRSGDPVGARLMLDQLVANDFDLPRDMSYGLALCNLSLSCYELGHIAASVRLFELLLPYRTRNATALCYYNAGCCSQYLGLLAAVLGRWHDSMALLEESLTINKEMGSRLWYADTALAYANVAHRIGGVQQVRGDALRRVAVDELTSMGLRPENMPSGASLGSAQTQRLPTDAKQHRQAEGR